MTTHTHISAGGGTGTATHTHPGGGRQHAHVAPRLVKDERTGICWDGTGWVDEYPSDTAYLDSIGERGGPLDEVQYAEESEDEDW